MRFLTRAAFAALALTVATGTAIAQDPIGARQKAMKTMGGNVATLAKMMKGDVPYDGAKAQAAFEAIGAAGHGIIDLFPKGSDKGDTKATAKIWEDEAGFKADFAKFEEAVKAAAPEAAKDQAGLKSAFGKVINTCNACHDTYRKAS